MGSPVKRPMKRNLEDPILYRAFCTIIKDALLIQMEKGLLDDIFGLAPVTDHSERNSKDEASVAVEQDFQGRRIVQLQSSHCFIIGGNTEFWEFWLRGESLLAPGQSDGKRERSSLRQSTHGLVPTERPVGDAIDNTTVASENSPGEVPMVSRQYTRMPAEEKIFRCEQVSLFLVQNHR